MAAPESGPDQFNEALHLTMPRVHDMGVRVVEVGPGLARGVVPLETNTNHLGTMYAGALFTVAEILGGALFFATFDLASFYPVVKELTITFRRPARTAVSALATLAPDTVADLRSLAEHAGKAEFRLDVEILDDTGQLVAITHGTYQIRRHGS